MSGVGGQYNFVAMAHELEGARSILLLRATREAPAAQRESNIVFNYGHTTIPRHLRDIVVTEYGIADLRGRTDAEVAAALIAIADARFQEGLAEQAKAAGKLPRDWQRAGGGARQHAGSARGSGWRRSLRAARCRSSPSAPTSTRSSSAWCRRCCGSSAARWDGVRASAARVGRDHLAVGAKTPRSTNGSGFRAPRGWREALLRRVVAAGLAGCARRERLLDRRGQRRLQLSSLMSRMSGGLPDPGRADRTGSGRYHTGMTSLGGER